MEAVTLFRTIDGKLHETEAEAKAWSAMLEAEAVVLDFEKALAENGMAERAAKAAGTAVRNYLTWKATRS